MDCLRSERRFLHIFISVNHPTELVRTEFRNSDQQRRHGSTNDRELDFTVGQTRPKAVGSCVEREQRHEDDPRPDKEVLVETCFVGINLSRTAGSSVFEFLFDRQSGEFRPRSLPSARTPALTLKPNLRRSGCGKPTPFRFRSISQCRRAADRL